MSEKFKALDDTNAFMINARIVDAQPTFLLFTGTQGEEILKLEPNGDIYVHGKLVENDKQVVDGLRYFLGKQGF